MQSPNIYTRPGLSSCSLLPRFPALSLSLPLNSIHLRSFLFFIFASRLRLINAQKRGEAGEAGETGGAGGAEGEGEMLDRRDRVAEARGVGSSSGTEVLERERAYGSHLPTARGR